MDTNPRTNRHFVCARVQTQNHVYHRNHVVHLIVDGVVPGPAESALSTHVLSRVYTALTERGEPLTVCRAKHVLSEGAGLLPVNQYALQELPLKRLQQQREDNGGPHQLVECKSSGCLLLHVTITSLTHISFDHLVANLPTHLLIHSLSLSHVCRCSLF